MYHHPEWLWYLIAVVVIGTVAMSLAMDRANSGQHVRSPGAMYPAPAGDPATVTRHVERPGEDTIRFKDLAVRIAAEARLVALARKKRNRVDALVRRLTEAQGGRHRAIDSQRLFTHAHQPLSGLAA